MALQVATALSVMHDDMTELKAFPKKAQKSFDTSFRQTFETMEHTKQDAQEVVRKQKEREHIAGGVEESLLDDPKIKTPFQDGQMIDALSTLEKEIPVTEPFEVIEEKNPLVPEHLLDACQNDVKALLQEPHVHASESTTWMVQHQDLQADSSAFQEKDQESSQDFGVSGTKLHIHELQETGTLALPQTTFASMAEAPPATETSPLMVNQQILSAFPTQEILKTGPQTLQLALNPPHLGELTVHLKIHDGTIQALFKGQQESLDLLKQGAPDLFKQLEDQGFSLNQDSLQFDGQPFQTFEEMKEQKILLSQVPSLTHQSSSLSLDPLVDTYQHTLDLKITSF